MYICYIIFIIFGLNPHTYACSLIVLLKYLSSRINVKGTIMCLQKFTFFCKFLLRCKNFLKNKKEVSLN